MGVYNALQPGIQSGLQQYMQDPLTASYFLQMIGMANKQNSLLGQRGASNILSNLRMQGLGGQGSGLKASLLARNARGMSALQSNSFMNALFAAEGRRGQALGQAQGYNPLVTGQNSTQTTKSSGLGTWLPQTLGMIAGIGLAPFTGGLSLAAAGGLMGGMGGSSTPEMSPFGFSTTPGGYGGGGGVHSTGGFAGGFPSNANNAFLLPSLTNRR